MRAGFAAVDITPPVGSLLNGFIARIHPSSGIDSPLKARALVLERARTRTLLISLDLLGISPEWADTLADRLGDRLSLSPDHVILACTHTHSGPMTTRMRGLGGEDGAFLAFLEQACSRAALEARESLQPVRISWSTAPLRLACNRREEIPGPEGVSVVLGRNPAGPTDTAVRVLRLQNDTRSILLFHYACHPYCLGGDCTLISADFWGHAADALAAEGHDSVYLNGCCGNLSPELAFGGPAAARSTGQQLADAVMKSLRSSRESSRKILAVHSRSISLPYDTIPDLEEITAGLNGVDRTVRDVERSNPLVTRRIRQAWQEWLADLRAALQESGQLPPLRARVSVARIGDGAVVALPGEMFYEAGCEIASGLQADPVCVASYGHGYIGYIPTPEAFPLGGYEVEEAHRYLGLWRVSPLAPAFLKQCVSRLWSSCSVENAAQVYDSR